MRERAVKSAETAVFASIYVLQKIAAAKIKSILLSFQLRSTESGWNNVGKLEIVFRRAWLIAVALPNWIIS